MAEDSAGVPPGVRTVVDAEVAGYLEACRLMIDLALAEGPSLPALLLIKGSAMAAFDIMWKAEAA